MAIEQKKSTCGPLWRQAFEDAKADFKEGLDSNSIEDLAINLFSWGHLVGQAEKVYLGACVAAMFRPSTSERSAFVKRIRSVSKIYGLLYGSLSTNRGVEYWLFRESNLHYFTGLHGREEDHEYRGWMCGIPKNEIDVKSHYCQVGPESVGD